MAIKAYFFHEPSEEFFVENFTYKDEYVIKIGLVRNNKPSMNGLMAKILKNIGTDSGIFEMSMKLLEYNHEHKNFKYVGDRN